jgi:hypothetical protein
MMAPLVIYWRDQCFDAYEALMEIERVAKSGASSEVVAHLAHKALYDSKRDDK